MYRFFLLSCFLLIGFQLFGTEDKDSLKIVELFFQATHNAQERESALQELSVIKRSIADSDTTLRTFYTFSESKYLMTTGRLNEAMELAEEGLELFRHSQMDHRKIKFYNLIASVHTLRQEYKDGINFFKKSLAICERTGDKLQAAYALNNIANLFFSLLDEESAYIYASRSFAILKEYKDDPYYPGILSILSVAETKTGRSEEGYKHAVEALKIGESTQNILALIVANHALGDYHLTNESYAEAKLHFSESLTYSEKFAQEHFSLLNNLGLLKTYLGLKDYANAVSFGNSALILAESLENKDVLYALKRNLASVYHGLGQLDKAYVLLKEAHAINREITNIETKKSINELLIKYDAEKKEKEIANGQLLLLEKDIEAARFRQIILFLSIGLVLLTGIILLIRNRNINRIKEMNSKYEREVLQALLKGEEVERKRLAVDLHDGLSSSLTSIRFRLESLATIKEEDKRKLIESLQETQLESRRIAHNLSPIKMERLGLIAALQQFAQENSTEKSIIHISDFSDGVRLNESLEMFVYRITQELIQNALKHAKAGSIDVQFFKEGDEFRWMVEDDGDGFDLDTVEYGEGLQSIRSRINQFKGSFDIDTSHKGTIVQISIPIMNSYF